MGVKIYDHQDITGIVNSGTTDGTGSWSVGVNIGSQLVSMPPNSAGLIFQVVNTSSSPRWAGIRTNGFGSFEFQKDFNQLSSEYFFIPFNATDKLLDFYRESNELQFRVIAALDETWTFFNIASRPVVATTGTSYISRIVSDCPINSTIVMSVAGWRPSGATTNPSNVNLSGQRLVKLDGGRAAEFNTQGISPSVVCYTTGTVDWTGWLSSTLALTANSTWTLYPTAFIGKRMVFASVDKSSTVLDYDFRQGGSSYSPSPGNQFDENFFIPLNSAGEFGYNVETGAEGTVYNVASIPDAETTTVSITSIDKLIAGEVSEVVFSNSSYAATGGSISDGVTTKTVTLSGSLGVFSFLCPLRADGIQGLRYGSVTFTATNGATPTSQFIDQYDPPAGVSCVTLTSVDTLNYGAAASPAYSPQLKIGSQCEFNPLELLINPDGSLDSVGDFIGASVVGDLDPDDRTFRVGSASIASLSVGIAIKGNFIKGNFIKGNFIKGSYL